jgi:hypothetical protein
MNYWNLSQIPIALNQSDKKNITLQYSGQDQLEFINKNPDKDYWDNINIEYQYNAHGFRTYDLEKLKGQRINVALGCSHTEGIGLPAEWVWPALLEKQTHLPILNLGQGGGATDTVARLLTNISGTYDIQTVYIQWPEPNRFEIYNEIYKNYQTQIKSMFPLSPEFNKFYVWNTEESISKNRFAKNQLIVHLLSKQFGFVVKEMTIAQGYDIAFNSNKVKMSSARDGVHWGLLVHEKIADYFLNS